MKVKEYLVLSDCVERGVATGRNRAYKYTDTPTDLALDEAIIQAVMNEICEYFDFDTEIGKENE